MTTKADIRGVKQFAAAQYLRQGYSMRNIAMLLKVDYATVYRWLNPEYAARAAEIKNARRRAKRAEKRNGA